MMSATWRSLLDGATAPQRHQAERMDGELQFAERLCQLHPARARAWRPLIAKARACAAAGLARGTTDGLPTAVAQAERILAPLRETAKRYTVHCVGHAHIDMNWMWSWPETVAVTIDTFTTVLRLMEEYPAFRFSQSQASTYAIVEEHQPEMLAQIARRVREGRWEVTASHWVEGDKNLAGGESLCRHLLYTRAYIQKLFGLGPDDVPIDWSPDTFGHAATVPTYLVRGGVKYLYLHRPGTLGATRPEAFWWKAPDGSRVLVRNDMKLAYNGRITPLVATFLADFVRETGCRDYMFVYGVGDHGGGPTRRDIVSGLEMDRWPIFPHVRFSTAGRFFRHLEEQSAKLPVIERELNYEFTGCYTTQTLIKKDNRYAEQRLVDAELAASLAWLAAGRSYPATALRDGWCDTLFSHFHDILPGSGVHDTRTYTHGLYQKTAARFAQVETGSLRLLAARIDSSSVGPRALSGQPPSREVDAIGAGVGFASVDGGLTPLAQGMNRGARPVVLFNPSAWERAEVAEVTIWDDAAGVAWQNQDPPLAARAYAVRDGAGRIVPGQIVQKGSYWGHDYVTLAFPARLAGHGYALYAIEEQDAAAGNPAPSARQVGWTHHCSYAISERSHEGIENERIRVDLDPVTGGIRRLVDKASGAELISPARPAPALEYAVERPHGMTAWCVDHTGPVEAPAVTALRRKLAGPHKASIEVDLKIHESDFTLTYELRAGDPRLYLTLAGTWFQRGTPQAGVPVLRLALPVALAGARARYEIPFGAIDRENGPMDVPALQWAQVSGRARGRRVGLLLLNDSKHGHCFDGDTLRLTLIRSSYDPDILPEIGQHTIRLAILPYGGEMPVVEAIRRGIELNHGLRAVTTDVHKGDLPRAARLLAVESRAAVVSAIKKAEEAQGLIVRLYNPTARAEEAVLRPDATHAKKRLTSAREVDLLERPMGRSALRVTGGAVRVRVPPRGISSVLLEMR